MHTYTNIHRGNNIKDNARTYMKTMLDNLQGGSLNYKVTGLLTLAIFITYNLCHWIIYKTKATRQAWYLTCSYQYSSRCGRIHNCMKSFNG